MRRKFSTVKPLNQSLSSIKSNEDIGEKAFENVKDSPIVKSLASHFERWRPELLPPQEIDNQQGVSE